MTEKVGFCFVFLFTLTVFVSPGVFPFVYGSLVTCYQPVSLSYIFYL